MLVLPVLVPVLQDVLGFLISGSRLGLEGFKLVR